MRVWGHGDSDIGLRREVNEDRFAIDNALGVYVVADGMGGKSAGDLAAAMATRAVMWPLARSRRDIAAVAAGELPVGHLQMLVIHAMEEASQAVLATARRRALSQGMGTTMTLVVTAGDVAVVGHVGDSRAYLYRDVLPQLLTRDHTVAAEMLECGLLDPRSARRHPYNHILTRSLGREGVTVDSHVIQLMDGDRLLLCTDGLTHRIADEEALGDLLDGDDLEGVVRGLIDRANLEGGHDNVSAIVVQIGERRPRPRRPSVPFLRPALPAAGCG